MPTRFRHVLKPAGKLRPEWQFSCSDGYILNSVRPDMIAPRWKVMFQYEIKGGFMGNESLYNKWTGRGNVAAIESHCEVVGIKVLQFENTEAVCI